MKAPLAAWAVSLTPTRAREKEIKESLRDAFTVTFPETPILPVLFGSVGNRLDFCHIDFGYWVDSLSGEADDLKSRRSAFI